MPDDKNETSTKNSIHQNQYDVNHGHASTWVLYNWWLKLNCSLITWPTKCTRLGTSHFVVATAPICNKLPWSIGFHLRRCEVPFCIYPYKFRRPVYIADQLRGLSIAYFCRCWKFRDIGMLTLSARTSGIHRLLRCSCKGEKLAISMLTLCMENVRFSRTVYVYRNQ